MLLGFKRKSFFIQDNKHETFSLELIDFARTLSQSCTYEEGFSFSFSTISPLPHQVFIGNVDTSSVVQNKLKMPQVTRWVRIVPRSWNNHIGMRVELYGC